MSSLHVLIVDDDQATAQSLAGFLSRRSFTVAAAEDGRKALSEIRGRFFDVVLLDIHLPGQNGIEILRQVRELSPKSAVVMMTAYASVDSAIAALRLGAADYIIKPFDPAEILHLLERLSERKELLEANEEFSLQARTHYDFSNIVTRDPQFLSILDSIKKAAATKVPVNITGESGTGKELVARALHTNSDRSGRPLIAVNCAAITPSLMESEFFGHVKGAFTGALADHKGYFERAHKSSLFLDEIGELPLELQAKLLRVLQEGQINRVGDSRTIDLDFRLIAASQRDLAQEIESGRFRKDLYYRLNLFTIILPPLRRRPADIPLLVDHFLALSSRQGMKISDEALAALQAYEWPGNVRELANVIERAAILAREKVIQAADLPLGPEPDRSGCLVRVPPGEFKYKEVVKTVADQAGRELILRALARFNFNVSRSAVSLGVSRRFLTYRIKELGIKCGGLDESEEGPEQ